MVTRSLARRAVLTPQGAFASRIFYIIRDDFLIAATAPLAASVAASPGGGLRKKSLDTDDVASITSEILSLDGSGVGVLGDPSYYWTDDDGNGLARAEGLAMVARFSLPLAGTNTFVGWVDNIAAGLGAADTESALLFTGAGAWDFQGGAVNVQIDASDPLTVDFRVINILRSTGSFIIVKQGTQNYYLWYFEGVSNSATVWPAISATGNHELDQNTVRTVQLTTAELIHPVVSDDFSDIPTITDVGVNALIATSVNIGFDGNAAHFGGDSHIDLYSAAFDSWFDGAEGGIICRQQMTSAGSWINGETQYLVNLRADTNNKIALIKNATSNQVQFQYGGGGTIKNIFLTSHSPTTIQTYSQIWSEVNDAFRAYLNTSQLGATQTGLGTFAGNLLVTNSVIGAFDTTPSSTLEGKVSDFILFNNFNSDFASINTTISNIHTKLDAGTLTAADLNTYFGSGNWVWFDEFGNYITSGDSGGHGAGKSRNGGWFYNDGSNNRVGMAVGEADVILTGDFASDSDWDKGTGWAIAAGIASKTPGTGSDLGQTVDPLTAGIWCKLTHTVSGRTAGTITPKFGTAAGVARSTNATFTEIVRANGAAFDLSGDSSFDGDEDDVILVEIPIADMLDLVETSTPEITGEVPLTVATDTQGGVALAWDSLSTPANGLLAYFDRVNNDIVVEKWLAGVFSSELVRTAATYSAGATLKYRLSDADADDTYDLHIDYNDGATIADTTFNDAAIVDNTKHGLFLSPESYAEAEVAYGANRGTQYDPLLVGA